MHGLRTDGEVQEESDHYSSQWEYLSGSYHLVCVESYDLHWANEAAQPSNFELYCPSLNSCDCGGRPISGPAAAVVNGRFGPARTPRPQQRRPTRR